MSDDAKELEQIFLQNRLNKDAEDLKSLQETIDISEKSLKIQSNNLKKFKEKRKKDLEKIIKYAKKNSLKLSDPKIDYCVFNFREKAFDLIEKAEEFEKDALDYVGQEISVSYGLTPYKKGIITGEVQYHVTDDNHRIIGVPIDNIKYFKGKLSGRWQDENPYNSLSIEKYCIEHDILEADKGIFSNPLFIRNFAVDGDEKMWGTDYPEQLEFPGGRRKPGDTFIYLGNSSVKHSVSKYKEHLRIERDRKNGELPKRGFII